ncbi:hypothetical protein A3D80_04335 [Candidatus Roizmanbacteria bacterium RIFCSPHIGHO2_02_FULL_40_13b]|nr:MAG: hypothetical protein A3D80_04335 [Candidatus Roizmanbacteria bacterium RIFCSPHIGHO2_02_FULL_40_13b]OGK49503.1 MAG: hypothetical protein A3A56_02025 [Candidatus Roizmanbacteria bacterium RIFCSPLOWO2_01_FULL_40_32]
MNPTDFQKKWISKHWKQICFLILLVVICYIQTLPYAFLSDDISVIQNNPYIGDFGSAFVRPQSALRSLLYTSIHTISGASPILYRLSNILFHMGSVIVVFATVSLLAPEILAFFTASFFAIHPLAIESVTWISGGTYSQYGFFMLTSFFFYIVARGNKQRLLLSILFFGLSLWSSEKAAILPLIILWYELCFGNLKDSYKKISGYMSISFFYGLFYIFQIKQRISILETNFYEKPQVLNSFYQIPIALSTYLSLFFVPVGLSFYHTELSFSAIEFIIRLISTIGLFTLIIYAYKKQKFIAFWLGFFAISLFPTLTPLPVAWVVAERYVYVGIVSLCAFISWFFYNGYKNENTKIIAVGFFGILLTFFLAVSILRNNDWKDQDALWIATAVTSPNSPQNHNNLGDLYARRADLDRAIIEFKRATELNPNYGDAFHNLANTYQQKQDYKNALKYYQKAISINPNLWQSYQNMARIYFLIQRYSDAEEAIRIAIKINPQDINLYKGLISILLKEKKNEEAQLLINKLSK